MRSPSAVSVLAVRAMLSLVSASVARAALALALRWARTHAAVTELDAYCMVPAAQGGPRFPAEAKEASAAGAVVIAHATEALRDGAGAGLDSAEARAEAAEIAHTILAMLHGGEGPGELAEAVSVVTPAIDPLAVISALASLDLEVEA